MTISTITPNSEPKSGREVGSGHNRATYIRTFIPTLALAHVTEVGSWSDFNSLETISCNEHNPRGSRDTYPEDLSGPLQSRRGLRKRRHACLLSESRSLLSTLAWDTTWYHELNLYCALHGSSISKRVGLSLSTLPTPQTNILGC